MSDRQLGSTLQLQALEHGSTSAATEGAWRSYLAAIDEARALALNSRWAQTPQARAQALYYIAVMQAFGFNTYMGPRQAYPTFFSHLMFTPVEYAWGAPSPDFRYHWTAIDGTRTYRIWGRRGNTPWLHIQAQRGWWGDADQTNLGSWDVDTFQLGEGGSFEMIASASAQTGNWMKLDPTARNICLLVRDIWDDWETADGATIHIELMDPRPDDTVFLTEEQISERLAKIAFQTKFSLETWLRMNDEVMAAVGSNAFFLSTENVTRIGGNPLAAYVKMLYDIRPDDALIIECEIPTVRYWSLQLADYFFQTTDFRFHQSSLNNRQARIDADGKARLVLSAQDPGVPNWLDPSGLLQGFAQWRWYISDRFPVPTVKRVPLTEVRAHLPPDTPVVSPAQRQADLIRRGEQIRRRMGV